MATQSAALTAALAKEAAARQQAAASAAKAAASKATVQADIAANLNPATTVTSSTGTKTQTTPSPTGNTNTTNTAPTANDIAAAQQKLVTAQNQANAAQQATALLESYGLGTSVGAGITSLAQAGLDSTTITSILDSPDPMTAINGLNLQGGQLTSATNLVSSWQQRFSGNQARIAAGLTPLDPATYIANEQSYKQVMTMAGIPDSSPLMQTSYLGNLIGADVSPAEVKARVDTATSAIQNEDPEVINQLKSQYGLSDSTIVSHLLDPSVSAPVVQQEYQAATIAAEAARAGVAITVGNGAGNAPGAGLTNQNSLQMQLAAQGVTQAQAAQGFQTIAEQQPALQSIASRYGAGVAGPANVGQALQASTFNTTGAAAATQQLNLLKTAETSAFSGSAGAATGSLGLRDTSGLS